MTKKQALGFVSAALGRRAENGCLTINSPIAYYSALACGAPDVDYSLLCHYSDKNTEFVIWLRELADALEKPK